MPHILVAGQLHPAGLVFLKSAAGVTFDYVEEVSEASYAPLIGKADGLVIRTQPMSAATIEKAERLKVVSRHGVGYDAVDIEALNARGIATPEVKRAGAGPVRINRCRSHHSVSLQDLSNPENRVAWRYPIIR